MNNIFYIKILFLIFLTSMTFESFSKHIVGGEATYKLVSSDGVLDGFATYDFKFIIYRDAESGGADFDATGFFGVFLKNNLKWQFVRRIERPVENKNYIQNVDDPCVITPSNILYEKGEYNFRLTLKIIDAPYQITYQRCCRTNFIINILSPEATGATYYVEISPEAQLAKNTSPVFKSFPPAVLCANNFFNIDHSATDIDGDSLVYEFFNPLAGGGLNGSEVGQPQGSQYLCDGVQPLPDNCAPPFPLVVFKPPYSFTDPLQGNPLIRINALTGIISGQPQNLGQFVVGVMVKEYRKGVLIGTIQRDFQFNVTACTPAVSARVGNSTQLDLKLFRIFACGADTVLFINNSYDKAKILSVKWVFDVKGQKITSEEWDGLIPFPEPGNYTGKLILNEKLACSDSADIQVNIYPGIHASFDFSLDSCRQQPVNFINSSYSEAGPLKSVLWDFDDGTNSSDLNPQHSFEDPGQYDIKLIVEDENKCKDEQVSTIRYFPVPDNIEVAPSKYIGCAPVTIAFSNNTPFIDGTYSVKWDFGDGTSSTEMEPVHLYNVPGQYDIKVNIKSPTGCEITGDYSDWLLIKEGPEADFKIIPEDVTILNPVINIENNSTGGDYHFWEFGTGDISYEFEPGYTYADTGIYRILYIITSQNKCTDTLIKNVDISPDVILFYPNAFTPNGDGKNDEFFGKGAFIRYMVDFKLTVWDRWGGMVFETEDPLNYWNGRKFNSGDVLPQGVYVFNYAYRTPRGKYITDRGFITLIK
ncbi:MAG: gliding motility-associated C-terminal domain-containing protein [Saprospiraceae bacterium]|nr:gliding motility-associated C-terminal domain-containing protein [Saprospiraceae bacterium]